MTSTSSKSKLVWALILAAGYIAFQMIADIAAVKSMSIGGLVMPAGTLVFALTFTWRDLVHKKLGKKAAQTLILAALCANVFMALYFQYIVVNSAFPVFFQNQEAIVHVLGQLPPIVIASILAEFVSEWLDTELYSFWVRRVTTRYEWTRVVFSNLFSVPVDSYLFAFTVAALAPAMGIHFLWPMAAVHAHAWGQTIFKWIVMVVSTPLIYVVKADEGVDI